MHLLIRPEQASDAAAIEAVTRAAFLNAPHTEHTEHVIVNALRDAGQLSISLVAVAQDAVIGHVAVSPVTVSDGSPGWYGLGPISVAPAQQGQGVGTQLMEQALAQLRQRGAAGCVVLGDPHYYGRFGFKPEPALVLPGVPPAYFQTILLAGPLACGTVAYHAIFSVKP